MSEVNYAPKIYWDGRKVPIHDKYGVTCLAGYLGDRRYIEYCATHKDIQDYWYEPEYKIESPGAGGKMVEVLTTNINPGDTFNLSNNCRQICYITQKTTVIGSAVGKPDHIQYSFDGERGGFYGMKPHNDLISSRFFVWLPHPVQLMAINMPTHASQLTNLMMDIVATAKL